MMQIDVSRGLGVDVTEHRGEEHGPRASFPGLKSMPPIVLCLSFLLVKVLLVWDLLL